MATPIILPKVGQSVETCILTAWYKKKGDAVKKDELLFSFETDKAAIDENAKVDGILLEIFFEAGSEVPVLATIGVIGQPGESAKKFRTADTTGQTKDENTTIIQEQSAPDTGTTSIPLTQRQSADKIKISPRAKKIAESKRILYDSIQGSGPGGRIIAHDIESASSGLTYAAYEHAKNEKMPTEESTGIENRITSHDLDVKGQAGEEFIVKKISNIRKRIADAMQKSVQNSAQLTHHLSADVRSVQAIRTQFKAKADVEMNITINDMICFAIIKALKQHPDINGHFNGTEIKEFKTVHLGIAVDTPRGLMVPAIKNADKMTLEQLSTVIKKRAEECRQGDISPDLLSSEAATFTVSNLGIYGIEIFTPVLNIPQIGIIGVNTIIQRPADLGRDIIGLVPFIGISLTYDHRAIDGAPASRFLQTVKKEIETFSL
jgi:pyruvate dehydrogenase E2 component (dihydrolipoamide acetyltransferase)